MNPRRHWFAIGMTVLILVFIGIASVNGAESKSTQANWENLKQLAPGQEVQVVLNDAKSYRGQLQTVGDDALVLRLAMGEQTFARQNVLRVSTRGKSHRGRNALIGLAVGAGAGVIVAVASPELGTGKCAQGSCVDAGTVSMVGFWGGVLGAGLGAAIPTRGWHDVYRAR
jgi:small nuclear ribonucleoprotein (snRNP)-like protein